MNMRRRAPLLAVFGIAAVVAALVAFMLPTRLAPNPDIVLSLLDGRQTTLGDWRGRPVLVAFWATSCAPCVEETPDLIRLYEELNPLGFDLIAVAMPYDPPLAVQNFVRHFDVPYPVALDVTGAVLRAFPNIEYVPTALLLDPLGNVLDRQVGKVDIARVRKQVAPFLSSLPRPDSKSTI